MISYSCKLWRGDKPCVWNKKEGCECQCEHYEQRSMPNILVIKLDALGDVLRTASLLPAIIELNPGCRVAFLTRSGTAAEIASSMILVDEVIELTPEGVARIATVEWQRIYNLSNDIPSASLARIAARWNVREIIGYTIEHDQLRATNKAAECWLEIASFDRLKKENRKTWQSHMLDIIGSSLEPVAPKIKIDSRIVENAERKLLGVFSTRRLRVGIYIGAGARWPKKMLGINEIETLVKLLRSYADVIIIGGPLEQRLVSALVGFHANSFADLVGLLSCVDMLICGDTLALHTAIAIDLPTVALFGPTSLAEIETFGLVTKLTTELDCLGCYGDCDKTQHCMNSFDLDKVADLVLKRLGEKTCQHAFY